MDDIAERLRRIEENPSSDLWMEIAGRHARPHQPDPVRGPRHRVVAGLVAAVVAAAAFGFMVRAFRGPEEPAGLGPPSGTTACQPDVASTWRTKMVPWLTSLLLEVGAPGGVPLTDADIIDTGSALQVLPHAYDGRLDVYVHAGVPDPEHDPTASPSLRFVGSGNGYRLYSSVNESGSLVQFIAIGSEVWLSLYVYSANPGGSVELDPGGNREAWINEMMNAIRVDPIPSC